MASARSSSAPGNMKWCALTCGATRGSKPNFFRCSMPAANSICGTIDDAAKMPTGVGCSLTMGPPSPVHELDEINGPEDGRSFGDQPGQHGVADLGHVHRPEVN